MGGVQDIGARTRRENPVGEQGLIILDPEAGNKR